MEDVPYLHKHGVREVPLWLITYHEKQGTSCIDFNRMSAEDLLTIVPDESSHLGQLQHTAPGCISQAAGQTNQRPHVADLWAMIDEETDGLDISTLAPTFDASR